MLIPWVDPERVYHRDVFPMLDAYSLHSGAALADPPARANGPKGDYPYRVASQRGAALALADRCDRDAVSHPPNDDMPEAA